MFPRTNAKLRRFRIPPTEGEVAAEQQQQQQQAPLRQRLPGFRPPPGRQPGRQVRAPAPAPQDPPIAIMGGQGQGPAERWERVPISIQLMNEICDAISIGSDFAFWSGLIIIVVVLVGLWVWYAE